VPIKVVKTLPPTIFSKGEEPSFFPPFLPLLADRKTRPFSTSPGGALFSPPSLPVTKKRTEEERSPSFLFFSPSFLFFSLSRLAAAAHPLLFARKTTLPPLLPLRRGDDRTRATFSS